MTATTAPVSVQMARRAWWAPALALAAAGWGANQFAPLIVMYRLRLDLTASELDAMYGLYALGLVPALLLGGRLSDRFGRRRIVLPALAIALVATLILMAGGTEAAWLYAGRLLTGLACGLVFGTGAAWLKESSLDAASAPRRTTIAITAGFAAGPFAAGLLAQWAPHPTVMAYLPHLLLVLVAVATIARGPGASLVEPSEDESKPRDREGDSVSFPIRAFVIFLVPFAPWVFGSAAVFLAYLAPLVAPEVGAHALVFCAVAATIGAGSGILAQPLAAALLRAGRDTLVRGAMALVVVGLAGGAWAAYAKSPALVLIDAVVLGMAFGTCQFCGLLTVQRIASPASLGTVIGAYQVLSYVGFAFPYLMSLAHEHWSISPTVPVVALTGVAVLAALWLAPAGRSATTSLVE
ncbi:MFS transporter [Luteipulveratus mongoliensis]|uniref:Major facilitator superfamily (MFS) profile domain-containing protein n=1 Tax=Luteipulveratus mongoliensis TaxID=571913 RepID=A0A0K1JEQ7_9MICO|nr:MFS transporter [Luteipulveratus mongoliensis]AKU15080.1 hypothetical protein VV02_03070 [Luteipulveratus mongoliensis]